LFADGSTVQASELRGLAAVVVGLQAEIVGLKSTVNALTANATSTADDLVGLKGAVANNTENLVGLQTQVTSKAEKDATDTQIQSQQSALDAQSASFSGLVDTVKDNLQVLNASLTELSASTPRLNDEQPPGINLVTNSDFTHPENSEWIKNPSVVETAVWIDGTVARYFW
jgi:chromosome segregation ATPase